MSALYVSVNTDAIKREHTARGRREITAHVRGWNSGVEVTAQLTDRGTIHYFVTLTGGSNGAKKEETLADIEVSAATP